MTPDAYLLHVLARERAAASAVPLSEVFAGLAPTLYRWGNGQIASMAWSGSLAKGTAIGSADVDLFISLHPNTAETLAEIHRKLFNALSDGYFLPEQQNVSICATVFPLSGGQFKVDVVPGKRWDFVSQDHSLYRSRARTWTKTNINRQIAHVRDSGRVDEIAVLKLWRDRHALEIPSCVLELAAIEACWGRRIGDLANNVWAALTYIRDELSGAVLLDPANGSNRVTDDMTASEKRAAAGAADRALRARTWGEIVW